MGFTRLRIFRMTLSRSATYRSHALGTDANRCYRQRSPDSRCRTSFVFPSRTSLQLQSSEGVVVYHSSNIRHIRAAFPELIPSYVRSASLPGRWTEPVLGARIQRPPGYRKFPIGAENFDFEAKIENPVETSDNISSLRYALLHRVHAQVIWRSWIVT